MSWVKCVWNVFALLKETLAENMQTREVYRVVISVGGRHPTCTQRHKDITEDQRQREKRNTLDLLVQQSPMWHLQWTGLSALKTNTRSLVQPQRNNNTDVNVDGDITLKSQKAEKKAVCYQLTNGFWHRHVMMECYNINKAPNYCAQWKKPGTKHTHM